MKQTADGAPDSSPRTDYLLDGVLRACDLVRAFHYDGEVLRLRDLVERTGINKTTAFRVLASLERGGLIEKTGRGSYRAAVKALRRRRYRIGYASQSEDAFFAREVTESIRRAASAHEVDLIVVNNRYSQKVALRNADLLVGERVDLVIEFQTYESVAPLISAKFLEARIPMIAVEIPHPGATFYGGNNYEAGRIGGRALGMWAKKHWQGQVEEILLLELPMAGLLPQLRLQGTLAGIRQVLPGVEDSRVIHLDGKGTFEASLDVVRRHLRQAPERRTLVGAINDQCALGALRAFEEAGRSPRCAVMGQNAIPEARAELRRPNTRLAGSVAFFPERYGEALIRMALDILNKRPVPPAVFVHHRLATPETVDQLYPNDSLIMPREFSPA